MVALAMKWLLFVVGIGCFFCSCDKQGDESPKADAGDSELTCDPLGNATLATHVQPIFDVKCKTCHEGGTDYGDFTKAERSAVVVNKVSVYAGAAKTLKVVDPGSLENSSLWLKISGGASAGRTGPKGENVFGKMPNDSTILTAAEKKIIKDWICSGAQ